VRRDLAAVAFAAAWLVGLPILALKSAAIVLGDVQDELVKYAKRNGLDRAEEQL
jgi:hypothetical protein